MEAIFLVCGAGGPQLKRNPLGSPMLRELLLLSTFGAIATPLRGQEYDTLTDADLALAGVQIGSPRATVLKLLGAPITSSQHRLTFPGLAILLDADGRCDEIVVTSPRWPTARGLRVGDTLPRIFALYGEWAALRDSLRVIYERSAAFENERGMIVLVRGGKVIEIDVGLVIDHS